MARRYPQLVLQDSPLAFWQLGEASGLVFTDVVGGNNLTIPSAVGVTHAVNDQHYGVGLGINGIPATPTTASNIALTAPCSIEVVFNLTNFVPDPINGGFFGDLLIDQPIASGLQFSNGPDGPFNLDYYDSGGAAITSSLPTFTRDTFYHLVVTVESTLVSYYINGALVNSYSGSYQGFGLFYFFASTLPPVTAAHYIENVAAYDHVLTPSRILVHAKASQLNRAANPQIWPWRSVQMRSQFNILRRKITSALFGFKASAPPVPRSVSFTTYPGDASFVTYPGGTGFTSYGTPTVSFITKDGY